MSVAATIISFLLLLILKSLLRLDFFPAFVVYLAVLNGPETTILCSSFAGFIQDALFFPGFLNFLSYTVVGGLAVYLKRFFAFEKDALALTLVLIAAPASVLIVALSMRLFEGAVYPGLILSLIKVTVLNGVLVFIVNHFFGLNDRQ